MSEQTDSQYLTTCDDCIHNEDCPCMWSKDCTTCILIQQKIEEKQYADLRLHRTGIKYAERVV